MLKISKKQRNTNHNQKISSPYRTIGLFLVVSSLLITTGCSSNNVVEEGIQIDKISPTEVNADLNIEEAEPFYSETVIDGEFLPSLIDGSKVVRAATIQTDGKILLGTSNSTGIGEFVDSNNRLIRLNPDGSLDTAFTEAQGSGPEGLLVDFASGHINAIAVQDDGKIIVGGDFRLWDGITVGRIVRLNPDGSLDAAFTDANGEGALLGTISSIVVQPDGKIIIAGGVVRWNGDATVRRIVRLNPDGSHDKEFTLANGGGSETDAINVVTLQNDGKILLGLQSKGNPLAHLSKWDGNPVGSIVRLNPDGSFDNNFNIAVESGAGKIHGSSLRRNTSVEVNSIVVQPDGKIIIGGDFTLWGGTYIGEKNEWGETSYTYENASPVHGIVRLNPDGSLDTSFTEAGGEFSGADPKVYSLSLKPDGKILFASNDCWFTLCLEAWDGAPYARLFQLNSDGSIDANFRISGYDNPVVDITKGESLATIIQPDGKIIIASTNGVVRLGGLVPQ